jgi:sn-glycerol 3-phosphate transport system substrate-binding protein
MSKCRNLIVAALLAAASASASAQTQILWWHGLGGQLGQALEAIAEDFNKSQSEYKVVAVYKGSYTETLTAAISAFRSKQNAHPHIVQVFDAGTATMIAAREAIYPVYQLMADQKEPFDPSIYIRSIYGYYATTDGKLLSMPFNSSTPVLYWNKAHFKQAGLDPEKPPKTWPELGEMGKKLVAAGIPCGFTPQWQTWTMTENLGAWHNVPYATKANGFGGLDAELKINTPFYVRHIQTLADWGKTKVFVYGGREGKSTELFSGGKCGMHVASSGSAAGIQKALGVENVGVTMMPYWPDTVKKPQNSIVGGATLWVLRDKPKAEYAGVAKFFSFLSKPETQAKFHQSTGYVPITMAAADLTAKQGFYKQFPGREIAVEELALNPPTEYSKGIRLGSFAQIRDVVDEELEAVWSGSKNAQEALDSAVKRGNRLLKAFAASNRS